MIRVGKESRLNTAQVLDRAAKYFGPDGVGLELVRRDATSVELHGGGGYVTVSVRALQDSAKTDVEIVSRDWDQDATRFLEKV